MRKKRLIIVLAVAFLLLVGAAGAVYFRNATLDKQALACRERGLQAAEAGEHTVTLDQVGRYLQRFGMESDVEALYAYAMARKNVPAPNNKHLQQAMAVFARILDLEPGHAKAQKELLDLYTSVGFVEEAIALADRILPVTPDGAIREELLRVEHIPALKARAIALARQRKPEEALQTAVHTVSLEPQNQENYLLVLSLMEEAGKPSDDVLTYAQEIAQQVPERLENHMLVLAKMKQAGKSPEELLAYAETQEDALASQKGALQLLKATACEMNGNREETKRLVEQAAGVVSDDFDTIVITNNFLKRVGSFDASISLLERTAAKSNDTRITLLLVRQLFEQGNAHAVLEKTREVPVEEQETSILAVRAMAFASEKGLDELNSIADELERREGDDIAQAWAPLLRSVWGERKASPAEVLALCDKALEVEGQNPYFHFIQAVAYERLGESDHALRCWQDASRYAPTWVEPAIRSAALCSATGNTAEAVRLATGALQLAPRNLGVAAEAASIIGGDLDRLNDDGRQQLFKLVEQIQTESRPFETRTLPLYAELLALNGDVAGAAAQVKQGLDSGQSLPEAVLLQLARVSETYALGLADACYDKAANTTGVTPRLAFARAAETYEAGDADRGLQILTDAVKSAGSAPGWETVIPEYLELTRSETAAQAWAKAADENPGNTSVQRRVLSSRAAWQDTALIERTIERLKAQTGERSVSWKVARARWLLVTDTSERAAAEAVTLLNDVIRSSAAQADRYTLLAAAFERLNNYEGALFSLTNALQKAPDSNAVRFQLARVSQMRGQTDRATRYVEDILRNPSVSQDDVRRAAALFAGQNELDRAIDLQLRTHPPEDRENPPDLLLAEFYRRANRPEKAEAICRRILEEGATLQVIQFTADLLASQGRTREAENILARLDGLEARPGSRESILAEYHGRYGSDEEAQRQFEAAINARREDPAVWKRYLAFLARSGKTVQAVGLLNEAAAACPAEPAFERLVRNQDLLRSVAGRPLAQPLIAALIESPVRYDSTVEALGVMANTGDDDPERLAIQLRQLTERYPDFLALKMQLVRLYGNLGRHEDAAKLAAQAMRDFPTQYEPAWLAAEAYAATGQWLESLRAAEAWRNRAMGRAEGADLLIAEAQIRLGEASQALDTLRPYVDSAAETGQEGYSPALFQQARALVVAGQLDEAAAMLEPRLQASRDDDDAKKAATQWRMAWVRLASNEVKDEAAAAEWLTRVTPLIPEDDPAERLVLASGWYALAGRSVSTEASEGAAGNPYRQNARAALETLAARGDAGARLLFDLAVVADIGKDYATSEAYYLRALDADPTLAVAKNNLAMRYILEERRLDDALKLAREAAESEPLNASFHDTVAQAQAALGNYDAAIQSLSRAAELEPAQRKWRDNIELIQQRQRTGDDPRRTEST